MFDVVSPDSVSMDSAQLGRVSEHLGKYYLEPGKISGSVTLVARRGQVCLLDVQGYRDVERALPMTADSIMRIYSMTKPITSLAMMTLHEKGLFSLDDPVHRFIPGWRDLPVWKTGSYPLFETVPARRAMTIRDLFMHTSGITYDFLRDSNIDYAYRKAGVGRPRLGYTLQQMIDELAQMPLLFSPGDRWNYSLSTDVLGYLIEILSGQSLPDYLRTTIFEPLGMHDTCFEIPADKVDRFASCYTRNMEKGMDLTDDARSSEFAERTFYSGGGGLLSTAGRLLPLLPDVTGRRHPGRSEGHRPAHAGLHDSQSLAGRSGYGSLCDRQFQ